MPCEAYPRMPGQVRNMTESTAVCDLFASPCDWRSVLTFRRESLLDVVDRLSGRSYFRRLHGLTG